MKFVVSMSSIKFSLTFPLKAQKAIALRMFKPTWQIDSLAMLPSTLMQRTPKKLKTSTKTRDLISNIGAVLSWTK
jgi:hypothetical protein